VHDGRLYSGAVDEAGDLDAGVVWQFADQSRVRHVAVDHGGLACDMELTIAEAYSFERSTLDCLPARRERPFTRAYSSRFASTATDVLVDGIRYRAISSSWLMNHGTYSAACSLDSVG